MITREKYLKVQAQVKQMLLASGIIITPEEVERIEVADFGLGDLNRLGLQLITYVNTHRVCAKELILFPRQTCPEHLHPAVDGEPGKEETFRCRWGKVYLYVPGFPDGVAGASAPSGFERYFTVAREIRLAAGEQYTLAPDMLHWFQAGDGGAIVSEFSTRSRDQYDIFTDPRIVRAPKISS